MGITIGVVLQFSAIFLIEIRKWMEYIANKN